MLKVHMEITLPEFYLVEAIDEASKIDSSAMGVEWIQLSGNPYLKNMIWSFKK